MKAADVTRKALVWVALPALLQLSCAPNPDVARVHDKLHRLRVLLEHRPTMPENLRRSAQATRLDFEAHRQDFSQRAQAACDDALLSAEILASFDSMRGRDPPVRHCAELSKAGAYDSELECQKEMGAYKDSSTSDGGTRAAVDQLNRAVLHLALVRLERAAQQRMRNAESLTAQ